MERLANSQNKSRREQGAGSKETLQVRLIKPFAYEATQVLAQQSAACKAKQVQRFMKLPNSAEPSVSPEASSQRGSRC